jgi:hypothetical protein
LDLSQGEDVEAFNACHVQADCRCLASHGVVRDQRVKQGPMRQQYWKWAQRLV